MSRWLSQLAVVISAGLASCAVDPTEVELQTLDVDLTVCLGTFDGSDAVGGNQCRVAISDRIGGGASDACLIVREPEGGTDAVHFVPLRWAAQRVSLVEPLDLPLGVGQFMEAELYVFDGEHTCADGAMGFGQACDGPCVLKLIQRPVVISNDGVRFDFYDEESGRCLAEGPMTADGDMGAEVCDGADNDCDGRIDEFDARIGDECESSAPGVCAAGNWLCCRDGDDCDPPGTLLCRPQISPGEQAETCDAIDNDCDGQVDEGLMWVPDEEGAAGIAVGGRCERGTGDCFREGLVVCTDDGDTACTAEVVAPAERERCDERDNDCDGATDEDLPTGQICEAGVGECKAVGATVCDLETGDVVCNAIPGNAWAEACDGLDNDCDGEIDEDFSGIGLGERCEVGVGECHAVGLTVCTANGLDAICNAVSGAAQAEICDNDLDDDCDGEIDENFRDLDQPCVVGVGACRREGIIICDRRDPTRARCSVEAGAAQADDPTCDNRDDDCDGLVDEDYVAPIVECGDGACAANGRLVCLAGSPQSTCRVGQAAADDPTCDGRDDDCDGDVDEDYPVADTVCGIGECRRTGVRFCVNGAEQDTCLPGPAEPDDRTCDGRDDDCDGVVDEDWLVQPTACGVGVCAAAGERICVSGGEVDTCVPQAPAENDVTCDGRDDDCDGLLDEEHVTVITRCGVGQCASSGQAVCVNGAEQDTCLPNAPALADDTCDGRDDDCDGLIDEDFEVRATVCGVGVCARTGELVCLEGGVADTCEVGAPEGDDSLCDGRDADCDGLADEAYVTSPTVCGAGACSGAGILNCVDGTEQDTCRNGEPAEDDPTCDGQDDDCDGAVDEDFVTSPTTCGQGVCAQVGVRVCVSGVIQDTCTPGEPLAVDNTCNARDENCDGSEDEAFPVTATECAAGVCRQTGLRQCVNGQIVNSCMPDAPTGADDDCNGADDDCNGQPDDHFVPPATTCGVGECSAAGRQFCINGQLQDTCQPGQPAGNDDNCDGRDNDCDGAVDEGFVAVATECGVGACVATGETRCEGGEIVDSCVPGAPAASDATCDAIDDDCNGLIDEDFVSQPTVCGEGACGDDGVTICQGGVQQDTCRDGVPAADDATCDGQDDDCDGRVDEDYAPMPTVCGDGVCAAIGQRVCVNGREQDTCTPGQPAPADVTCDNLDDDCDRTTDEDYSPINLTCGVGECFAVGQTECNDGQVIERCTPRVADVERCGNSRDDDCDGVIDEGYPDVGTPCTAGVGQCAADGFIECAPNRLSAVCGATPGSPAEHDICDGIDNNCDGRVDEADPNVGSDCDTGDDGVCGEGERVCNEGSLECAPINAPSPDICNLLDDDCDGSTDEGFDVGKPCSAGVGACERIGEYVCLFDGSDVVCDAQAGQPAGAETCNNVDDDCDGAIDEGTVCANYVSTRCKAWLVWSDNNTLDDGPRATWGDCPASDRDTSGTSKCTSSGGDAQFWDVEVDGIVDFDDRLGVAFTCADAANPDLAAWIQGHCAVFIGYAANNGAVAGTVETWGPCPAANEGFDAPWRCVGSGMDGQFHAMRLDRIMGFTDDDLGVAFICRDAAQPDRAAGTASAVDVWFGWDNDSNAARAPSPDWSGCPADPLDNGGNERCGSSGGDQRFHRFIVKDAVNNDDSFGIALTPR